MAGTFHMDPAQVLAGTEWDFALRLAARNRLQQLIAAEEVNAGG